MLQEFSDPQYTGSTEDGIGLDFVDVNNGWVLGEKEFLPSPGNPENRAVIHRTIDGGQTWENQTGNGCPYLYEHYHDIDAIDANTAWLVGNQGLICHTSDGGATWTEQPSGLPSNVLETVDFVNANIGYVGAYEGPIIKTTDGGQTWTQLTSLGLPLFDIDFITEDIGFAARWGDGIFKTEDGGNTWTAMTIECPPGPGCTFTSIDIINDIE
jgi:photosystem II stability/assembly factor-like uncharacterized protein